MNEPPFWMTGAALDRWQEMCRDREWRDWQLDTLAAYCAAYGRWCDAEKWLATPGHGAILTIRDDKGNIKSHGPAPQVAAAERARREMSRLLSILRPWAPR
jgi:phage terminase small subunit